MGRSASRGGIGDVCRGRERDNGFTFVEVLVTIVLVGIATVGTMTALQVSLRGSDQHRSRVSALADLQSAGAYLAREGHGVACPGATAAEIEDLLDDMPGSRNPGIAVSVNGDPTCASGLPRVSLTATHQNGRAQDSLDVVIGGITVLSPGSGSGGGGLSETSDASSISETGTLGVGIDDGTSGRIDGGGGRSLSSTESAAGCAAAVSASIVGALVVTDGMGGRPGVGSSVRSMGAGVAIGVRPRVTEAKR